MSGSFGGKYWLGCGNFCKMLDFFFRVVGGVSVCILEFVEGVLEGLMVWLFKIENLELFLFK